MPMLTFSRVVGESVIIDGQIRVLIKRVRGDKVSIGIDAPGSIRVDREEVHKERLEEARNAGTFLGKRPSKFDGEQMYDGEVRFNCECGRKETVKVLPGQPTIQCRCGKFFLIMHDGTCIHPSVPKDSPIRKNIYTEYENADLHKM